MKKITDIITEELKKAFEEAGFDSSNICAVHSNRPDLCEFQCNGAMSLAKQARRAPLEIAQAVAGSLAGNEKFESVEAVKPGFININLSPAFLSSYVNEMGTSEKFGTEIPEDAAQRKVIIDYGGPNIAKPLHIGHLRSAIIGESVKRILRYMGQDVTGDIHLGDWGLQMGQIIAELHLRQPDLPYFDENFEGEYPEDAPFTISELEEIYPTASKKCKAGEDGKIMDEEFS